MHTKIQSKIEELKNKQERGLMTHVVLGYPDLATSIQIAMTMAQAGADFIELQIPFSDPMGDGPTIRNANEQAVSNKVSIQDCMGAMSFLVSHIDIPIFFMSYFNSIFVYGVENFCEAASLCGAVGVIVPDYNIDHEDQDGLLIECKKNNIDFVHVLNPASTKKRVDKNIYFNESLIYFGLQKSVTGTTQKKRGNEPIQSLQYIKQSTNLPIAGGWGVRDEQDILSLPKEISVAIVGSSILDLYNSTQSLLTIKKKIQTLKSACKGKRIS